MSTPVEVVAFKNENTWCLILNCGKEGMDQFEVGLVLVGFSDWPVLCSFGEKGVEVGGRNEVRKQTARDV